MDGRRVCPQCTTGMVCVPINNLIGRSEFDALYLDVSEMRNAQLETSRSIISIGLVSSALMIVGLAGISALHLAGWYYQCMR